MRLCISPKHEALPHELPCLCCVGCAFEHMITMEVFVGPGIASRDERPVEVLTLA